jgi:hypothetical protein
MARYVLLSGAFCVCVFAVAQGEGEDARLTLVEVCALVNVCLKRLASNMPSLVFNKLDEHRAFAGCMRASRRS